MSNESLVLKSSREIDIAENQIDDWQRVGEVLIPIVYRNNENAVMQISFQIQSTAYLRISGGSFFSDSDATELLPNEMDLKIADGDIKKIYFKVHKNAVIGIKGVRFWGVSSGNIPFIQPVNKSLTDNPYPIINLEDITSSTLIILAYSSYKGNVNYAQFLSSVTTLNISDNTIVNQYAYGTLSNDLSVQYLMLNTKATFVFPTDRLIKIIDLYDRSGNVQGDIKDLPSTLRSLKSTVYNNHKLFGDIKDFNNRMTQIYVYSDGIYGDISQLQSNVLRTLILRTNKTLTYSMYRTWGTMSTVQLPRATMSTSHIDNLLIDLSNATWNGEKTIILKGSRTSASDNAVDILTNNGVTITFNVL